MRSEERPALDEGGRTERSVLPLLEESDVEVVDGELVPRSASRAVTDDR